MRVVVFGGRNYDDRRTLCRTLDAVHARRRITCIIEGEMSGADLLVVKIQHLVPVRDWQPLNPT